MTMGLILNVYHADVVKHLFTMCAMGNGEPVKLFTREARDPCQLTHPNYAILVDLSANAKRVGLEYAPFHTLFFLKIKTFNSDTVF
jgi:hypothetical protein